MSLAMVSGAKPIKWWLDEQGDSKAADVFSACRSIMTRMTYRSTCDRIFLRLFTDVKYCGFGDIAATYDVTTVLDGRLTENVMAYIIRTICSKFAKQRPKPEVLVESGNWRAQQQARLLAKWLWGAFLRYDVHDKAQAAFLNACTHGTGFVIVQGDSENITIEVAPSWEIMIDPSEGRYGEPRTIYRVRMLDREVLRALFPGHDNTIDNAKRGNWAWETWEASVIDPQSDMVRVVEAWHLPSGPDAGDGEHVICVDSGTLYAEEWTRSTFPIAVYRYNKRPIGCGYFGEGLIEALMGQQVELNRTYTVQQESMRLLAAPMILLERGAKVVKSHLNNMVGRIIEYTGAPPQVVAPSPISPAVEQHKTDIRNAMMATAGTSEMSAQGLKPAGLDSGKALRAFEDIEQGRFATQSIDFETFYKDISELILEAGQDLDDPTIDIIEGNSVLKLNLKDINLPRNAYRVRIAQASALSTTLTGRLQDAQDLRDLGAITKPSQILSLINIPDLEGFESRELAQLRLIERVLDETILTKGRRVVPEKTWDLALCLELGTDKLAEWLLNAPDEPDEGYEARAELLRLWIADTLRQQSQITAATQPPQAAPGGVPQGALPAQPAPTMGGSQ